MKNRFVQLLIVSAVLYGCGQNPATLTGNIVPAHPPVITASLNFADKETVTRYESAINSFFDRNFGSRGFNGSFLVAKDGEILAEGYRGFRDPVQKNSVLGEHDAFHLASVSKTFTGMAILKLWEDGKLGLDDDLSLYFDKFPYPGTTIKMLLNHRSGLPNYTNYLDVYKWDRKKFVTNLDVLASLYKMRPSLQFPTGKRFSYCNTNYALLALIVEKVSGISYHDYMQQTFFTPLQMNDTYVFQQEDLDRSLPSYEWNNRKYGLEFMDLVYGDKNIYSTVRDMLKWDQALYNGQLFKDSTLAAAFTGYSYEKAGKRNYGLGWRLSEIENGKKIVYHNGWWHGNNTVFIRLPEEKATIILLGNKYNRNIYRAKQLCDLFGDYKQSNNLFQETDGDPVTIAAGGSQ
ncbi:serine hydrolase domain-containing protein [Flavihumibacter solisilvae]|uniref:serine hydrolase domain-containing protein n=1 Tax=Flavihumibacter solisilvae TaxID=1349421 RepID=UPI0009E619C9|nr:serine hydrolase domain-containing protein [Flavihumibacter solisilvae]